MIRTTTTVIPGGAEVLREQGGQAEQRGEGQQGREQGREQGSEQGREQGKEQDREQYPSKGPGWPGDHGPSVMFFVVVINCISVFLPLGMESSYTHHPDASLV